MQSREVMRDKLCEGNHSSLSLRSTPTPEIWEQITHPMLYIEARLLRRTLAPPAHFLTQNGILLFSLGSDKGSACRGLAMPQSSYHL